MILLDWPVGWSLKKPSPIQICKAEARIVCPDGTSISQISRLLYVAQRTRYAAFVFLHSVVERAIELCKFGDAERDALRLQIPYTKSQALDGCLEMLAEVQSLNTVNCWTRTCILSRRL
ncbi:unnamed protein product [Clonostachys rosea f. rosea IK726]|uniref:Uncharacterized protein n=1 Tax=Clonostachys rosea f. rosea IK726 TaxID=1349383 RepID=A0ACA9UD10_BIOOC|nr:unnamed protein product [Clonostachys rosea f. rosea IK726]